LGIENQIARPHGATSAQQSILKVRDANLGERRREKRQARVDRKEKEFLSATDVKAVR
jgi:hypothetical protein